MNSIRKISVLFFLLLFVTETFGIYKFAHFCGDEKTSESIFIKKTDCCCSDMEQEDDNCCSNETKVIQNNKEESFVSDNTVKQPQKKIIELPFNTSALCYNCTKNINTSQIELTLKSSIPDIPLVIKHRTLLI